MVLALTKPRTSAKLRDFGTSKLLSASLNERRRVPRAKSFFWAKSCLLGTLGCEAVKTALDRPGTAQQGRKRGVLYFHPQQPRDFPVKFRRRPPREGYRGWVQSGVIGSMRLKSPAFCLRWN